MPNFTTLTFQTEAELRAYIARRKVRLRDDYGRPLVKTYEEGDDLFLHIGYSYAEQPDGTWKLVF